LINNTKFVLLGYSTQFKQHLIGVFMSHQISKLASNHRYWLASCQRKHNDQPSHCLKKLKRISLASDFSSALLQYCLFICFLLHLPVHAQVLGNSSTLMQKVINELTVIGGLVVTIAIMFCGFRMVFQAAQWKDIAPIFWGGVLIGGAASIAGTVLS
jgi:type IV secretion system protein VirB2